MQLDCETQILNPTGKVQIRKDLQPPNFNHKLSPDFIPYFQVLGLYLTASKTM